MRYIKKDYGNRQVHLGLMAYCNKGDKFGLLYGVRKAPYDGKEQYYESKLFYFDKETDLEITQNTLVSYLSYDYNGFTAKVDYVYPVSSLVRINDKRSSLRADGVNHDDETWKLINEGIPYFDYEPYRNYCIYYPIIENNICTIWRGLFGCGIYMMKEAHIYEMYKELTNINYLGWPTLDEITNAIIKFQKHIDSINAFDIMETYKIMKIGRYISRPGKDDHYFEDLYQSLPYDDKFLAYLLPQKQENIFLDNDAYLSDGYRDGVCILEKETRNAIEKAKAEYSKEKHLAFLINDYYTEVLKKKERSEFLNKSIQDEFCVNEASKFASIFKGKITEKFISLVNDYNKSTEKGPLNI